MIFKCKNCGGNVVYDPERKEMVCPYCDGIQTQEREAGKGLTVCSNCGAPMEAGEYGSAVRCEYCGHYTIFEERVEKEYRPQFILPFRLGQKTAAERMKAEFKRRIFAPDSFLSEASVGKMEGSYVPFWLYDMSADCYYSGTGTKVRVWTRGDTQYTETSYYQVIREMEVDFDKVPVDASIDLNDEVMDLLEPYQYGELEDFAPEYMSGFLGEVYNKSAEELSERAEDRAREDAKSLVRETVAGYSTILPQQETIQLARRQAHYALLPVWCYRYRYREKDYDCFVNGQTRKVVGKAPVSAGCIAAYGGTFFLCMLAIMALVTAILEVL